MTVETLGLSLDWDREISTCSEVITTSTIIFLDLYDKVGLP